MLGLGLGNEGLLHPDILGVCGPHYLLSLEQMYTHVSDGIQCYPAVSGFLLLCKEMGTMSKFC